MIDDEIKGEKISPLSSVHSVPLPAGQGSLTEDKIKERSPLVIYLNAGKKDSPPNPWKTGGPNGDGLTWGTEPVSDFAERLADSNYFDNTENPVPLPINGDIIVGMDKDDTIVALRVSQPVQSSNIKEQSPAPSDFKE